MTDPDRTKTCVRVDGRWVTPGVRVEQEHYGCDTGCMVWCVSGPDDEPVGIHHYWSREKAVEAALLYADEHNLDVFVSRDLDP